jgi:hypothetical protein
MPPERPMPTYFFHSQTESRMTDVEGTELGGPIEARREAIRTCGEMMKDSPESFWGSRPWTVTVTDHTGLILWEISMDGIASAATTDM